MLTQNQKALKDSLFFITLNLIIILICLVILPTVVLPIAIVSLKLLLVGKGAGTSESMLGVIALSGWIFILTEFLSLIPSHYFSMKLANYLREKRGWVITHPRRLFVMSLLIPVILLMLLATFGRNS